MAVFCGPSVVKVNVIRSIGSQIANKESLSSLILVLQSDITNQAMKAVDIWPFKVEIFQVHFWIMFSLLPVLLPLFWSIFWGLLPWMLFFGCTLS